MQLDIKPFCFISELFPTPQEQMQFAKEEALEACLTEINHTCSEKNRLNGRVTDIIASYVAQPELIDLTNVRRCNQELQQLVFTHISIVPLSKLVAEYAIERNKFQKTSYNTNQLFFYFCEHTIAPNMIAIGQIMQELAGLAFLNPIISKEVLTTFANIHVDFTPQEHRVRDIFPLVHDSVSSGAYPNQEYDEKGLRKLNPRSPHDMMTIFHRRIGMIVKGLNIDLTSPLMIKRTVVDLNHQFKHTLLLRRKNTRNLWDYTLERHIIPNLALLRNHYNPVISFRARRDFGTVNAVMFPEAAERLKQQQLEEDLEARGDGFGGPRVHVDAEGAGAAAASLF